MPRPSLNGRGRFRVTRLFTGELNCLGNTETLAACFVMGPSMVVVNCTSDFVSAAVCIEPGLSTSDFERALFVPPSSPAHARKC